MLALNGLGRLDDPGLPVQLGFLVRDHEHFRQLLAVCVPEHRTVMYEALRPNLRFTAKPLDAYMAETHEMVQREQLPTVTEDGKLESYRIPELRTTVQLLVETASAKGWLTLVCKKCTFEDSFGGADRSDAIRKAREEGWIYAEPYDGGGIEICPKCSELMR